MVIIRLASAVGFCAYLAIVLIPIPAILLACSILYYPIRRMGATTAWVDFFQYFVGVCTWILCIRHSFVPGHSTVARRGTIILANHRSWCDFPFDNHLTRATVVSRSVVQYAMLVAGALQVCEHRVIRFRRGRTNKEDLYSRLDAHMRRHHRNILLYPEGKRMRHLRLSSVDECKATLKPGLLWMIYNKGQYPVQVVVSSNKERVLDERALSIRLGVAVRTYAGPILHPRDYASFECFVDAIATQWYEAWTLTHSTEDDAPLANVTSDHNTVDASSLF